MTNINIYIDGSIRKVEMDGHADGDKPCMCLSLLIYTLDTWLMNHADSFTDEFTDGHAELVFDTEECPEAETALELFVCGVLQVQENFPKCAELSVKISKISKKG